MAIYGDKSRRIRGEFFSQLEEALEKLEKDDYKKLGFTKNQIIDIMIDKYQNKEFTNLISEFREFRRVLTSPKKEGVNKSHVHSQVREYLKSKSTYDKKTGKVIAKSMSVTQLYERTSYNVYAEDQIIRSAEKLNEILFKFDISQVPNKSKVKKALKELAETINEILSV